MRTYSKFIIDFLKATVPHIKVIVPALPKIIWGIGSAIAMVIMALKFGPADVHPTQLLHFAKSLGQGLK